MMISELLDDEHNGPDAAADSDKADQRVPEAAPGMSLTLPESSSKSEQGDDDEKAMASALNRLDLETAGPARVDSLGKYTLSLK